MAEPIIHCVRHAQGFHNLGFEFHTLLDPRLTPLGEEQCAKLQQEFQDHSKISLVTASPLSRTLHTAILGFKSALENGKCIPEILAIPDAQETSDYPCDTGTDLTALRSFCKEHNWPVDSSLLRDGWNVKSFTNRYSPTSDSVKARAKDARKLIRNKIRELTSQHTGKGPIHIVLVSHGGYLHYFTGDWEHSNKFNGTGWRNCEVRSYNYATDFMSDEDDEAWLIETMPSRQRRGKGDHPMLDRKEQDKLFEQACQGWEDQGLQNPSKIGQGTPSWLASQEEKKDAEQAPGEEPAAKNMSKDPVTGEVTVLA